MPDFFTLTLTSTNGGVFDFTSNCDPPLIERSIGYMQLGDQGPSHRRINVNLAGFFLGEQHSDIITRYQQLKAALADSSCMLYYNDGANLIINKRVYIDGINEPSDWKQYDGHYQIALHYFESTIDSSSLGILCSYSSQSGSFLFSPTPLWSRSMGPTRGNLNQNRRSYAGLQISTEGTITLHGFFQSENSEPAEIEAQIISLRSAIRSDGILTYGPVTGPVYAGVLSVPEVFPRDYCEYTLTFKHYTDAIYTTSLKRRFSRLHCNPRIKELPYCNKKLVQLLGASGQTVNYSLKLSASSISAARGLLETEVTAVLAGTGGQYGSGIELPGGEEVWDDDELSVEVNFSRYHPVPILANIEGNPNCGITVNCKPFYTGINNEDPDDPSTWGLVCKDANGNLITQSR